MLGYKTENGIVSAGENRFAVLSPDCVQPAKQEKRMDVKEVKAKKDKKNKKEKKEKNSK
jgi:hypothetical protein